MREIFELASNTQTHTHTHTHTHTPTTPPLLCCNCCLRCCKFLTLSLVACLAPLLLLLLPPFLLAPLFPSPLPGEHLHLSPHSRGSKEVVVCAVLLFLLDSLGSLRWSTLVGTFQARLGPAQLRPCFQRRFRFLLLLNAFSTRLT